MPLQSSPLTINGTGRVFRQTFTDLTQGPIEPEALALNRKDQTCIRPPREDVNVTKSCLAAQLCETQFLQCHPL